MNQPNYILKTEQRRLILDELKVVTFFRTTSPLWWTLYMAWRWYRYGFSFSSLLVFVVVLIGTAIWSLYGGKTITSSEPVEFRFYDDYMVFHVPEKHYNGANNRQETYTVKYENISNITYTPSSKNISIYGDMHYVWYKLDENNQLIKPAFRDEFLEEIGCFSWLAEHVDIDIVSIVEDNSPIKVEIREN